MANSASAKKRIRQNEKRRLRNQRRKRAVKQVVRQFDDDLSGGAKVAAAESLRAAYKVIDQTVSKGTIHNNTAARRKSALARKLNAFGE